MILVVGTGRSGTSEVARILHDELEVDMGRAFHLPDQFNKEGYFEDREFQSLNLSFYLMRLDHIKDEGRGKEPWRLWREKFQELINTKQELWGVKDPGIADFPALLNEYLKLNPQIIWCKRNKEDTINSLMRFKEKSRKEMERIYNQRITNLESALKDKEYLEIECYTDSADKLKKIKDYICQ